DLRWASSGRRQISVDSLLPSMASGTEHEEGALMVRRLTRTCTNRGGMDVSSKRALTFVVLAAVWFGTRATVAEAQQPSSLPLEEPRREWAGGGRLGLRFEGAKAVGSGSDQVGFGIGGTIWGGYEFVFGEIGLVPKLSVGVTKFLENDTTILGTPVKASVTT